MDGLSLSKIVSKEFPRMKIIIISGYDDFEYARQAIEVGVDQYLLKPVTRMKLKNVLLELKDKIEQDQEQEDYRTQFQNEIQEYEQFSRRRFYGKNSGLPTNAVDLKSAESSKYIEAHITEPIHLSDVAAETGVSSAYLSTMFKKEIGYNFIEYVNLRKIELARQMLQDGKMVYEVSELLGFENSTYFSRVFKRYTDVSPDTYRKQM